MNASISASAALLLVVIAAPAAAQNLLVNGSFEEPDMMLPGFEQFANEEVPGWDAWEGSSCGGVATQVELWHGPLSTDPLDGLQELEITAEVANATVCQVYAGLTAGCPATLCFHYTGRPGTQNDVPFDNDFTLTLSGATAYATMLTHAPYVAPPSSGWTQFCLSFVPDADPLTIAFSRDPETGDQGGAHIDAVELTQPMGCAMLCGNGATDAGEFCDDGNPTDGDGCDSNCTPSGCGNGVSGGIEACDDGNFIDGDGCDTSCLPSGCGSEVVVAPETCDPPGSPSGGGGLPCRADCTVCGDDVLQTIAGEQCDDGNATDDDGCDSGCLLECGNGGPDPGELCDDGNFVSGDGCDSNCTPTACGNDVQTSGEECDDGDLLTDDGCDAACDLEPCGPTPDSLCKQPDVALKSTLKLKDNSDDAKDSAQWKWKNGAETDAAEFGNPVAATDYWFCLYDQGALVSTTRIPFGGTCDGKPCWKATSKGFSFKSKLPLIDGATGVGLSEGTAAKAKASFKGKGALLDLPPLPPFVGPIVAQLVREDNDACWSASFPAPFDKDDGKKLYDKAQP